MPAGPTWVGKWKEGNEICALTVHEKNAKVNVLVP